MIKKYTSVTPLPIEILPLMQMAQQRESGGIVSFLGTVRDTNHDKPVDHLYYEAHPTLAGKILDQIIDECAEKWPIHTAVAVHRTGRVDIGDIAVMIVTGSQHRKDAYRANEYIIDRLKKEAPIWKKETYADGSSEWGNHCTC